MIARIRAKEIRSLRTFESRGFGFVESAGILRRLVLYSEFFWLSYINPLIGDSKRLQEQLEHIVWELEDAIMESFIGSPDKFPIRMCSSLVNENQQVETAEIVATITREITGDKRLLISDSHVFDAWQNEDIQSDKTWRRIWD